MNISDYEYTYYWIMNSIFDCSKRFSQILKASEGFLNYDFPSQLTKSDITIYKNKLYDHDVHQRYLRSDLCQENYKLQTRYYALLNISTQTLTQDTNLTWIEDQRSQNLATLKALNVHGCKLSPSFNAKILAVESLIQNIETNKRLHEFTNKVATSRIQHSWKTSKTRFFTKTDLFSKVLQNCKALINFNFPDLLSFTSAFRKT